MKNILSTLVFICIGLIMAFPAVAENFLDVVENAQRTINQKYPDESSIARKMAIEKLEKIAAGDKTEEEKIAAIQEAFPNQITEKASPSELLLKYAELGDTSYVADVLKQNPDFDVNRPRASGNKTALYLASEKGYEDIVKLLLERKADVGICDENSTSTQRGILPPVINYEKYSSLTIAARNGHLSVVKAILESGVGIESRDGENRTALYAAAANGKSEVVRFLCESKAAVNIYGRNDWTPLTCAANEGHTEAVKLLLKYKADLEMSHKDENGDSTALYEASICNHPDIVEILCKAGAKVNVYGYNGWTPLTSAAYSGYTEVVNALLKYGREIDLEMRNQGIVDQTPLYHAVERNHPETVEILCKAGAKLNSYSSIIGHTPLTKAVDDGKIEIIKILLKYGADPYQPNNDSWKRSAFALAKENKRDDIVALLRNPPKLTETTPPNSASSGDLKKLHEYVMESINELQNQAKNGIDSFIIRLQSTRSSLQERMNAEKAPEDYKEAVLDMLDTQIKTLQISKNVSQSPEYNNVAVEDRQSLALMLVTYNVDAYKSLNAVLRKYGLKEIDDASGRF